MNKEIKLIALDLDGTLLNSSKEISKENRLAINAARRFSFEIYFEELSKVPSKSRAMSLISLFIV